MEAPEDELQHEKPTEQTADENTKTEVEPTETLKDPSEVTKEPDEDEAQQQVDRPSLAGQGSVDDSDDIDKMLNELQGFQDELEEQQQVFEDQPNTPGFVPDLPSKPLDEFRFSLTAMEDTGEVDLDALLEDLCLMEKDLNANKPTTDDNGTDSMEPLFAAKLNSPISPTAKVSADIRSRLESVQEDSKELTPEEQQERIKAEKIRIALEKLRAARVKKLVVKVYNDEDPTSKTIAIDQTWTSWEVCKKMMRKNDAEPDPNWVLVERLPDLCIERSLEDHESVVDIVSFWPWDNNNKVVINNKRDKYALFRNPQNYLLSSDTSAGAAQLAEKSKDILLQEYFNEDAMRLPELDGVLYLKEGKKSWKKHYFALRASGIYYTPKGKTKSSRDLVCLIKFEFVSVYTGGAAFKKKFKAPTEHCFILKHPEYNDVDSKAIKFICADDAKTLSRWIVCIKLAKYGYQLLENYSETLDEMDKLAFTLDKTNRFPKAASFSVGQRSDENGDPAQSHILMARENAKAQSDRIKLTTTGPNFVGSKSFSVTKSKPDKRKPKTIGNLFSDAWKKGTESDEEDRPVSPDTPSTSSAGHPGMQTPNSTEPRSFHIENAINIDDINEEPQEPPVRPRDLPLFGPSGGRSNGEATERIPSPSEIKSMLESVNSPLAPPLPPKAFSAPPPKPSPYEPMPPPPAPISPQSAPPHSIPPPPPPMACSAPMPPAPMSFSASPYPHPAASPPKAASEPPPPPPPVARKPSRSNSNASQRSFELPSPSRETPSDGMGNSVPPPPVARKPSRSNSNASQRSFELPSAVVDDDPVDFPPPPPQLPPPVMRKPSRSGSMNENKSSALQCIRGSVDSLDSLPLPPPPETIVGSDADLPPPPPEVLFKSHLESSLARSNSESRGRSSSTDKGAPPPPPPKTGRPRLNSNGKPPPPPPLRKNSSSS